MQVVSLSPLRVASLVWQPRRGSFGITVVCKATYVLYPGEATLAHEQEDPNDEDNHWDDDPARSVYSPNDLVPFKPCADVVLVGNAFSRAGEPVRSLVARLAVAGIDKSIEVCSDRAWGHDGVVREGPPFTTMPLRYERASAGRASENPVGVHTDTPTEGMGLLPIPNLMPVGHRLRYGAPIEPVGFGPIAPSWPARVALLPTHAIGWTEHALAREPLPEPIDPRYFSVAPPDQRVERLRDDEPLLLENLHPEHARLVTRLPGVRPRAYVERPSGAPHELTVIADTLWIDTNRGVATLTWRGQMAIEGPSPQLRVLVAMESKDQRLSWADIERLRQLAVDVRNAVDPRASERPAGAGANPNAATPASARKRAAAATEPMTSVVPHSFPPHNRTSPGVGPSAPGTATGAQGPAAKRDPGSRPGAEPRLNTQRIGAPVDGETPAPVAARTLESAPPPPAGKAGLAALIDPALNLPADVVEGLRAVVAGTDPTMASATSNDRARVEPPGRHSASPTAPGVVPEAIEELARRSHPAVVGEAIQLLGYEPEAVGAVRARFGVVLGEGQETAADDRRALLCALARAEPMALEALEVAMTEGVDEIGAFTPPLVLVAGLLRVEPGDDAAELSSAQADRFVRRHVFGDLHVRAHLAHQAAAAPAIVYLPEPLANALPMFRELPVRILAELQPQQDEAEACPLALRALALARAFSLATSPQPLSRSGEGLSGHDPPSPVRERGRG